MSAVSEFAYTLLQSQTITHLLHLSARSYSEHKALEGYYQGIDDLIDTYIEQYQGKFGLVDWDYLEQQPIRASLEYMLALNEFVADIRSQLPQDSELQNTIDEIVSLIDTTIYKLRFLK